MRMPYGDRLLKGRIPMLFGMAMAGSLLALVYGCGTKPEASGPVKAPIRVEVVEPRPETIHETIVASAAAAAKVEYRVSAQVDGMLKVRHVDRGDRIKKGQLLFEIDPEEFELNVREQTANLDRAEAHRKFMGQELKRKEPLFQNGTLSQAQWDQLQFDVAAAEAERNRARVVLDQAERDLRLTTIRSPLSGLVLERYHETGEVVPKGAILCWIGNTTQMIFEIGLSDRDLVYVHQGDRVDVTVDAVPDQVFQGKITRISGNASPDTGTFPLEVTVANPGQKLLPGMVGRVDLPGQTHRDRLVIPLMAVQQELGGTVVYVVEKNRVSKKPVTLGKVFGDRVIVLDGIKTVDQVVRLGQGRLEAGDPVVVIGK